MTTNAAAPQIAITQGDMAVLLEDPIIALKAHNVALLRTIREQAQEIEKLKLDLDAS